MMIGLAAPVMAEDWWAVKGPVGKKPNRVMAFVDRESAQSSGGTIRMPFRMIQEMANAPVKQQQLQVEVDCLQSRFRVFGQLSANARVTLSPSPGATDWKTLIPVNPRLQRVACGTPSDGEVPKSLAPQDDAETWFEAADESDWEKTEPHPAKWSMAAPFVGENDNLFLVFFDLGSVHQVGQLWQMKIASFVRSAMEKLIGLIRRSYLTVLRTAPQSLRSTALSRKTGYL